MVKMMLLDNVEIEVIRKPIKNLYLRILPPDGRVVMTVPKAVSQEIIEKFALSKLNWIKRKQEKFTVKYAAEKQQFLNGEYCCLWGISYPLEVQLKQQKNIVMMTQNKIILLLKGNCTAKQREHILNTWYRKQLQERLEEILDKCEKIVGVKADEYRIKNMRTKWGTCNIIQKRIWLNLQLVKKPVECLEYVIIHELVHLLERKHNKRFYNFMDLYYPKWRRIRTLLNQ